MKIIEVNRYSCDFMLKNGMNKQESCFIYGVVDKNYVLVNGNSYDEEKRKELGVAILPIPLNMGGSLVISEGDIEVGILVPEGAGNYYVSDFVEYLLKFLHDKDIPAIYDGNDILIKGYKVCGIAQMLRNGMAYVAVHIAVNVDLDLIRQICTKPMNKEPKGLSEWGVTTEELVEAMKEYGNSR